MPKIMHINCAVGGSTGKIIGDIADHASEQGWETLLCAPCAPGTNRNIRYFRTSFPGEQGLYRRLNYLYGFQYGFAPVSTARIKRLIGKEKPDLVHVHCTNGFTVNVYSLLQLLKKRQIPTVITNHAEFFYTGGCPHAYDCDRWQTGCGGCPQVYSATGGKLGRDNTAAAWRRMKKAMSGFRYVVMTSVSPWVQQRASRSPVVAELPQCVVTNGVNTDTFAFRERLPLREKYAVANGTKVVFHPTASFTAAEQDPKGGRFVLELARRLADENVLVLVAGKHPQDLAVPGNMVLLGRISDQKELAEYYALADVTVVTGKRETFNMPVAESLCCGTPVVGFEAGGPESIALEEYSRFVPYGDVDGLTQEVRRLLRQEHNKEEIAELGRKKYDATGMAKGYLDVYRQLLSDRGV
ncbi:MAG: glycosyltransferase [Oscillospiraceae bacterium]|nr:glycosyltransferase [Oscillospiraceae bacterium]